MNKTALDMHKKEKHGGESAKDKFKDKGKAGQEAKQKSKPKFANRELNNVRIRTVSGQEIVGVVKQVTKFEIVLEAENGTEFIVLKRQYGVCAEA